MDTLLVYLLILGMIWTYLVLYAKKTLTAQYVLLASVVTFLLAGIISFFGVGINFAWIAIALVAGSIIYMLVLIIKDHAREYIPVILMSVGAILFSFSVNYVFNDVLEPHQQVRIKVALGLEDDPRGVGYNVNQSKIAIGSGGIIGKGFLNGTQTKLKYVPEQDTDFIYCTIGEEEGFAGSAFVVIMFMILILRIIYLAERQRSIFARVYGYCVAGIILFHLLINVGMVLGITPVIGIPLPFFSYGGSSLWGFSILLFIFLRLDVARLERLESTVPLI
ncbi:MAG: rod shape-determining protein RodA, partial [Bacteroidota bacterium]|nr:rod shape-determining protein RodA [Bacteroidota bacterium]